MSEEAVKRGRPAKKSKPAYVPSGKPRGRPKGPPKPPKEPGQRGRPRGSGTAGPKPSAPFVTLVKKAVEAMPEKKGVSKIAIVKHIVDNEPELQKAAVVKGVRKALVKLCDQKVLEAPKGMMGKFRVPRNAPAKPKSLKKVKKSPKKLVVKNKAALKKTPSKGRGRPKGSLDKTPRAPKSTEGVRKKIKLVKTAKSPAKTPSGKPRGRPKGTGKSPAKPAKSPGKPRGRPKGTVKSPAKPAYVPSGKPRGRPKKN